MGGGSLRWGRGGVCAIGSCVESVDEAQVAREWGGGPLLGKIAATMRGSDASATAPRVWRPSPNPTPPPCPAPVGAMDAARTAPSSDHDTQPTQAAPSTPPPLTGDLPPPPFLFSGPLPPLLGSAAPTVIYFFVLHPVSRHSLPQHRPKSRPSPPSLPSLSPWEAPLVARSPPLRCAGEAWKVWVGGGVGDATPGQPRLSSTGNVAMSSSGGGVPIKNDNISYI